MPDLHRLAEDRQFQQVKRKVEFEIVEMKNEKFEMRYGKSSSRLKR